MKIDSDVNQKISSRLQTVANILQLNADRITNPGLLNGKMGLVIFFYSYARYSGRKYYEELAGELLDSISIGIDHRSPLNISEGLLGFGWGIEYLVKNGFVEGDPDEILEEIEEKIFNDTTDVTVLIGNKLSTFDIIHYNLIRIRKDSPPAVTARIRSILLHIESLTNDELIRLPARDISAILYLLILLTQKDSELQILKNLKSIAGNIINDCNSNDPYTQILSILFRKLEIPFSLGTNIVKDANVDDCIKYCITMSCNNLLYNNIEYRVELLSTSVKEILVDKDAYWNNLLDKVNSESFGLELGWAGLGLLLMNVKIN